MRNSEKGAPPSGRRKPKGSNRRSSFLIWAISGEKVLIIPSRPEAAFCALCSTVQKGGKHSFAAGRTNVCCSVRTGLTYPRYRSSFSLRRDGHPIAAMRLSFSKAVVRRASNVPHPNRPFAALASDV